MQGHTVTQARSRASRNPCSTITISSTQGHVLSYDMMGRRKSDQWYGAVLSSHLETIADPATPQQSQQQRRVFTTSAGLTTERYAYDAAGRLTYTYRDDVLINTVRHDGAGRVMSSSGGDHTALTALGLDYQVVANHYSGDLLTNQSVHASEGQQDTTNSYDGAGNLMTAVQKTRNGLTATYRYGYAAYDGYLQASQSMAYTEVANHTGQSVRTYDGRGHITGTSVTEVWNESDTFGNADNRTLMTDANGQVLWRSDKQGVTHTLIVNGEVVGDDSALSINTPQREVADPFAAIGSGVLISAASTYIVKAGDNFAKISQAVWGEIQLDLLQKANPTLVPDPFDEHLPEGAVVFIPARYAPVGGAGGGGERYTVRAGDTLAGIAAMLWGDGSQWFRLAEANGLMGNEVLQAGQVLRVPADAGTVVNRADSFVPYNASRAIGDTTAKVTLPPPMPYMAAMGDDGCGVIGQIIVVVIAIVVAYFVGKEVGAYVGNLVGKAAGVVAAGAAGGAAGSVAGQGAAIAMGMQDRFSWKAVGHAALAGAVTAGVTGNAPGMGPDQGFAGLGSEIGNAFAQGMVRGAVSSVITQGLEGHFSWREVAASAVTQGLGQQLGGKNFLKDFGGISLFGNLAANTAGALIRDHGRIDGQAVLAQSIGQSLGNSVVGQMRSVDSKGVVRDGFGNKLGNATVSEMEQTGQQQAKVGQGGGTGFHAGMGGNGFRAAWGNDGIYTNASLDFSASGYFVNSLRGGPSVRAHMTSRFDNSSLESVSAYDSTDYETYRDGVFENGNQFVETTYHFRSTNPLEYAVGAAEMLWSGVQNSAVRIAGGVGSLPYLFGGLETATGVQESFRNRYGYDVSSRGAHAITNAIQPVAQAIQNKVLVPLRNYSESKIGDFATTTLGVTVEAGIEIASTVYGGKALQSSLANSTNISRVLTGVPKYSFEKGLVVDVAGVEYGFTGPGVRSTGPFGHQRGAVGGIGFGPLEVEAVSTSEITASGVKGPYRGGPHSETRLPVNDGLDSHHMPDRNADPRVTANDGPAIQMDPTDHAATSSNGKNGRAGLIYRAETADMISEGRYRDAMAREIWDVRRAAVEKSGDLTKYNEAMQEMLDYARKSGQLPINPRTGR